MAVSLNMARPTKLTPESHKTIVEAIGLGATYATAAALAGVEYRTLVYWMERGREETRGKFFQFFHDVTKAEAELKFKVTGVLISLIGNLKDKDKRAMDAPPEVRAKYALEYLKRRDRVEWGDNVKVNVGDLSDAELLRLLGLANQAAPADDDSPTP